MSGTLPKINPTQTAAWAVLGDLFKAQKDWSMADLFLNDPGRAKNFSAEVDGFYLTVLIPDIVNSGREEQGSVSV